MRHLTIITPLALAALALAGCSDHPQPTAPLASVEAKKEAGDEEGKVKRIEIKDACDPTTFNAALGDGACVRNGGVRFDKFIAELTKKGEVGAWHFAPPKANVKVGETLLAINTGGEVHTFTEVEVFGGGIVPELNQLSGNPVQAPECLALKPADFISPGGFTTDDVSEEGTELYQCCIHPWMRTVVNAKGKNGK